MHVCSAIVLVLAAAAAAAKEPSPGVTALPKTYVTAVAANVMDDPAFLDSVRQSPPHVLHLGHVLPLNSIFGPTSDYSGWNPALVPAREILDRRERIRAFIGQLHDAGVEHVVCYINPAILGGDHLTREGFWSLYDHWDDYRALRIGPKPDRDPIHWIQRERQTFGEWAPSPNYPLWLYRPCVNEPAWSTYHNAVVRLVAESGYDGVFVDDCILECHHDRCQEKFRAFAKKQFTASALNGNSSMGATTPLWQGNATADLRDAATHLFWQESIRDYLARIRRAARHENRDFIAIANWGSISRVRGAAGRAQSGKDIEVWRPATRHVMYEEAHPSGHLGPSHVFGYLLQYNHALAAGVVPVVHSYATTRDQVELGYAECAAGGGGAFVQPDMRFPEVRTKWRNFFSSNASLLEDFELAAPVALVLAYDELRYNNRKHLREALATAHALHAAHIPFAAIPKSDLRPSALAKYDVLVVPHVRYLDSSQIRAITRFVSSGGRVLTAGPTGAFDLLCNPRTPWPFPPGDSVHSVDSMAALVPQSMFDLVDALDLLDQKEFAARVTEIDATPPDIEPDRLRDTLVSLAGRELALTTDVPEIRTVMYNQFGRRRGTITVHAVRYAASITGEKPLSPMARPLDLTIPIPPHWKPAAATVLAPGSPPITIEMKHSNAQTRCAVPPFEYYALTVIQLERE